MVSKRRVLGLAVVLGFVFGGVIALVRMPKREAATAEIGQTNAVVAVGSRVPTRPQSATNEVTVSNDCGRMGTAVPTCGRLGTAVPTNAVQNPQSAKPRRKPITIDPKIPKVRQVLLANRRIAVASGRSFPKKFCATQTPTSRGTAPYVVISELPVSRDVRIQAVADGAKVIGFLPNNALLVEADAQALKNLEEDILFTAAVEYEPTDKIQRALLDGECGESGETVEAKVVLLNPKDHDAMLKFVTDNGGSALSGMPPSDKTLNVKMPKSLIEQLAGKAEVKWIERFTRLRALNDLSVQPACMNVIPVWNVHGLDGTGEVVTIDDTGLDKGSATDIHQDFAGKVVKIVDISGSFRKKTYDACGHGTHVAGSVVGSGAASDGQYAGVAKGAKLYFQAGGAGQSDGSVYFDGIWDYADIFAPERLRYQNYITSISLGNAAAGEYTYFCQLADETMWTYPELLVVVANGNSGPSARTVNEPAAAKSCLSVGNSYSTRNSGNPATIASSSSRGPCEDGRIKPEVTAPGQNIISTRSSMSSGSGDYTTMSGTSMATPHVAGAAAVVRQWLRRDRGFDNADNKPSGALMKAILTGGANGGTNPDNTFGWGRVDLEASICPTNGTGVFLADWLPFAAGSNFTFRVTTTNSAPLDVQLVWTDCPGESEAAKALVNDLDLSVSAAGEARCLPYVGAASCRTQMKVFGEARCLPYVGASVAGEARCLPYVGASAGRKWLGNGGTEPDDVNTVESVRISEADATTYLVRVKCTTVPYDFDEGGAAALYIRGAFDPKDVKRGEPVGTIWTIR